MVNQHMEVMDWQSSGEDVFDLGAPPSRSNEDSQSYKCI